MTSPQKPNSGSMVWIAIVAVVLLAGVGVVLFARGESDAGDQTSASIETVSEDGALPLYDATSDDAAVGTTIPTVTGVDFDGGEMTIGPDGSAQIIMFVAHWCPHCQREVPAIKAHLDESPMPDDVELVTVSTSVKPGADNYPPKQWLEGEGWTAPTLADDSSSSAATAFGLSSFPYFVAVDAEGAVVARASGELSNGQFDALVSAAQSGQA